MAGVNEKFPIFGASDPTAERGLNGMARFCERLSMANGASGMGLLSDGNGIAYLPDPFDPAIPFYNADSANSIPAYGVALLNGINTDSGFAVYKTKQPDTYGCQTNWLLNGPSSVPASSFGVGQAVFGMGPCGSPGFLAAYDSSDGGPALGDRWGPRSGGYLLKKNTGGFVIMAVVDSTNHIAIVVPEPMDSFYGKNATGSQIAKGSTGTINIYTGTFGSETDSGIQMTGVLARFGAIAVNAMVEVAQSKTTSSASASWYAIETDTCPA